MLAISDDTMKKLVAFRKDRDWEQFHTPRNLASALVVEAAELLECFRWAKDEDLARIVREEKECIQDEIADVTICLAYLCIDLAIDVDSVVADKVAKNAEKYPVERARGHARKYDRL